MTSCLCKLFETMIKNRFQFWIEKNSLLPNSQSGFRAAQSCTDNIFNLTLKAQQSLRKKKPLFAVFLDVCGAFDNVNIDILVNKLAEIGCPYNLVQFVKFITSERYIFNGETSDYKIRRIHNYSK